MTKKEIKEQIEGMGFTELTEKVEFYKDMYKTYRNNLKGYALELANLDIDSSNYKYKALSLIDSIQWYKSEIKGFELWFEVVNPIFDKMEKEQLNKNEYEKYTGDNKVNIDKILIEVDKVENDLINNNDGKISNEVIKEAIKIMTAELIMILKDRIGDITEVVRITTNSNRGFDGCYRGTKGDITINTILAGGYNIQKLHYRTLVQQYNKK